MSDNSKATQNGPKDLDFVDRARALAAEAEQETWAEYISAPTQSASVRHVNFREKMYPAALDALARVRGLHRKFGLYELEDSCTNTSEEHRQERHHEASDEAGEFYCEDMPIGTVCDECRNEDGERLEWPCATYKATEVEA